MVGCNTRTQQNNTIRPAHARMRAKPAVLPASPPDPRDTPVESERDQISQNIEAVLEFYTRENQKISRSQRILERISLFIEAVLEFYTRENQKISRSQRI